jgi:uncharacterized protein YegP (UPF0339 family)
MTTDEVTGEITRPPMFPRFEVYPSRRMLGKKEWRWRLCAGNSEIVATGEAWCYGGIEDLLDLTARGSTLPIAEVPR